MKKKIIAGAVTLLSVAALAACSTTSKDIVSMKGDTITVDEFYNNFKTSAAAKQALLQYTVENVFETKYGKKVDDKEVQAAYDKSAKQYGDNFKLALQQQGMTEESYRKQIRANMVVEYAVKQAAEKEITDETYKTTFEAYQPEVTVQVIKLDNEETAKSVAEKAKAGDDFANLAKENSTDTATKEKGGEMKFDSASSTLPEEVNKVVFGLNKDQVSDLVSVANARTGKTDYYIVKMVNKTEKKKDWKDYKDRLKEIQINQKLSDRNYINSIVSKELKEANIKVKDEAFQDVFSQFSDTSSSSSSK